MKNKIAKQLLLIAREIIKNDVTTYGFKEVDLSKRYSRVEIYEIDKYEDAELYLDDDVVLEYDGKYYKSMKAKTNYVSEKMKNRVLFLTKSGREIYKFELD